MPVGRLCHAPLYLAPEALLLRVPRSIDPVVATVFNPLGAGLRWGVEVPGTTPGDIVAVLGPGIRGLAASAAAKAAGAGFVMTTGLAPGTPADSSWLLRSGRIWRSTWASATPSARSPLPLAGSPTS